MKLAALTVFVVALVSKVSADRQITVYNACPFTIWPAVYTDPNAGSARPNTVTGWEAPAWSVRTFTAPDNWRAGRIWARRNCDFSKPGPQACLTGACIGGLQCTQPGVPPATLAEFTFDNVDDWYDVSLVDGYNLPMRITNTAGCPIADCPVDLGPNCPTPLKGPFDASGFPVGCKSACFANLDGNPGNSRNCCSGQFNTPDKCPASGVQFYDYFKNNCRNSYAYAYDEGSGTALFKCPSGRRSGYTITFCP